jgi:hypothetical protein
MIVSMSASGPKTEVGRRNRDFRFAPESRHQGDIAGSPKSAMKRLMHCSKSIVIRSLRRHGRTMPAMRRVATVDQLLR